MTARKSEWDESANALRRLTTPPKLPKAACCAHLLDLPIQLSHPLPPRMHIIRAPDSIHLVPQIRRQPDRCIRMTRVECCQSIAF